MVNPVLPKMGTAGFALPIFHVLREEIAREERDGSTVIDPYIHFLVSRKGTIYGITSGG